MVPTKPGTMCVNTIAPFIIPRSKIRGLFQEGGKHDTNAFGRRPVWISTQYGEWESNVGIENYLRKTIKKRKKDIYCK